MRSDWKGEAQSFIRQATAALPADATLKQRRSALRKVAHDFHLGTSWGAKAWSREVRKYLEQHGLEPLHPKPVEDSPRFADDIIFPFRQQEEGHVPNSN